MTLIKLGFSIAILCGLLALVALQLAAHIAQRRERIDANHPAIGHFITVNGARVHYKTSGSGPDIVLIHGASGNLREWEFGLRAALEGQFTVTSFDRPGHGHSDAIEGGAHLPAQAQHLHKAMQALGIRTPVLVGHSYGGAVALALALRSPPKSLVLISAPSLPWPGELDIWYRATNSWLGRNVVVPLVAALVPRAYVAQATQAVFAPQAPPSGYFDGLGAMLATRAHSLAANAAQVNALYDDITAQMAGYAALNIRVQLIHGDADTIVPLHIHAEKLVQLLPNAALRVLQGVGHMPHHADQPAVIAAIHAAASD